jgi:hypothetical protein
MTDITLPAAWDNTTKAATAFQKLEDMPAAADVAKISELEYRTLVAPAGLDDYTAYINALSAYNIYIPDGSWPFKGSVTFLNDVKCDGVLVASGSGGDLPRVIIGNQYVQNTVVAATLTGLTRGSTKITGLNSKKGQILTITSTEVASKRFGLTDEYVKEEVCVITTDSGEIWPPLMHTYTNTALMTVTVCNMPSQSSVGGLNIKGEYIGVDNDVLTIFRHNVKIEGLRLIADDSQNALSYQGCHVIGCFDVTIKNPVIAGFLNTGAAPSRLGYGINNRRSSWIKINDGVMYNNKHSVDALNSKSILVNGGVYTAADGYPIGAHYADGMEVSGATLNCLTYGGVGYSGGNLKVKGNIINGCDFVVSLRNDLPELYGVVDVQNNDIAFNGTSDQAFFGSNTISDNYSTYFGRTISWPTFVNIKSNRYTTASSLLRVARLNPKKFLRTVISRLNFEDNKVSSGTKSAKFLSTSNTPDGLEFTVSNSFSSSVNPSVNIKNNDMLATFLIYLAADNDTTATYKYDLKVENSGEIDYRVDVNSVAAHSQVRGGLLQARTATTLIGGDTVRTPSFYYNFSNIIISASATVWRPINKIKLKDSEFLGEIVYTSDGNNPQNNNTSRNNMFIYSDGNVAPTASSSANLPTLNGHFDAAIYQI